MPVFKVPPHRICGAMSNHHFLLEQNPSFRRAQVSLEHRTAAASRKAFRLPKKPYKISVVVHVLYSKPAQKIGAAQVKSQIAALNKDYRARNSDKSKVPAVWMGLATDAMIEFALATRDPGGKPTTGITYTPTTVAAFGQNDAAKDPKRGGVAPWPTDRYLNIWVCELKDQLLGYAQFPGGPKTTDGVVITTFAFGTIGAATTPFNRGRTCTHEVGHYLNLRHIWGDTPDCSGGDLVADTPNAEDANYGKPRFQHVSCNNGPNGDMFMNYMDYTDDDAMFMFTTGQVARMHAVLEGPRRRLWAG
jgi:hypothetical protein